MMTYTYTAAITLLVLLHYFAVTLQVAQARVRHGIKAPAVTGHALVERTYRVQMNMLEQLVFFLPSLWLCAWLLSDRLAAAGGLVWILGRVLYGFSYVRDPAARGPGITIAFVAQLALFVGAVWGLFRSVL